MKIFIDPFLRQSQSYTISNITVNLLYEAFQIVRIIIGLVDTKPSQRQQTIIRHECAHFDVNFTTQCFEFLTNIVNTCGPRSKYFGLTSDVLLKLIDLIRIATSGHENESSFECYKCFDSQSRYVHPKQVKTSSKLVCYILYQFHLKKIQTCKFLFFSSEIGMKKKRFEVFWPVSSERSLIFMLLIQ